MDEGTRRSLGLLTLPLSLLMKEPKMEMYQTTLMLSLGVHQSPIVVTVRLRVSPGKRGEGEEGVYRNQYIFSFFLSIVSLSFSMKLQGFQPGHSTLSSSDEAL